MGRPATAGTRGARRGRASLRALQDIQEASRGSRVTTVAPAVMVLQEAIAVGVAAAVLTILQGKQVSAILTAAAMASTPAARRRTMVPTSAPARRTTRRTRAAATPTRARATSPPVSSRAAPATPAAPPQQAQGLQASSQENQETARLEVERLETVMTQRRLQAVLEPMVELVRAQVAQMSQVWVCQQTPHCRALQRCL